MSKQVTKLVASSFGLVAFALAVVVGLSVGNSTDAILSRALISLIVAAFAGHAFGLVMEHLVRKTAAQVEARADAAIEEEEAALYAALHPERGPAGDAHGAHAHPADAAHSKPSSPRAGNATASSGGARAIAQPIVAGAGGRT